MTKVDVIRPGSLKKIIGPSGTLRRIINNKSYFECRGYQINVFTHDDLNRESSSKGEPVSGPIRGHSWKTKLRMIAKESRWLGMLYIIRDYLNVRKLISYYFRLKRPVDVVVFHSPFECYQFLKRNKQKVKTVLFLHTDGIPFKMETIYFPKLKNTFFFQRLLKLEEFVIRNVDRCVFITNIGRENFLNYYPFMDRDKTTVILNGIEDLSEEEKKGLKIVESERVDFKYRMCCTGTINTRKGQRIIIEALRHLDKSVLKDIHVTFVGEGPERPSLEELVEKYGLQNNVCFQGAVENSQVYLQLAKANIYILMSYNEGLPISIIEAMRMGLPVISTCIAGIPELVINEVNGILLEPNERQLITLFSHLGDHDWVQMGVNSRMRFSREFTFDRMKSEYCDMLDKVMTL